MYRMLTILLLAASAIACTEPPPRADLLFHGGTILTMDPQRPVVETLVIRDGRIVALGDATLKAHWQADEVRDLGGRTLMPGFDDAHIHVQSYAPHHIPLMGVESIAELQDRVRAMAERVGPGAWVTGYGWSEDSLAEGRRPLRGDLDAAAPDNPVVLTRAGGHSAVANSVALSLAEIDGNTPQPEGGVIEQDERGVPNGIIRERQELVTSLVPPATEAELEASLLANLRALLPLGITSLVHASERIERYPVWQRIYARHGDELPRAAVQVHWEGDAAMAAFRERVGNGDERLRPGAIKIFADGGFTGPAAFTKEPYVDQGDYRGYLNMPPEELEATIRAAHEAGWQVGIHAIGDAAIELVVEQLARTLEEMPRDDHRHYLNHFSMRPSDATMDLMAEHGIAITQQPNFTYTLEGRYAANLDGWRLQHNNPVRSPMEHGVFVALSSDILPIGPMVGLYGAVTRRGKSGTVYGADEAITMDEALRAYTHGGAFITFEEDFKGMLAEGLAADLIILPTDPRTLEGEAILAAQVDETFIDGRSLYRRATP
ncbi:MAG TPA: amidohydrolase [Pseudomonadales bacterium]|nr:amidohydrolase [Pseudomonadales bacterium]